MDDYNILVYWYYTPNPKPAHNGQDENVGRQNHALKYTVAKNMNLQNHSYSTIFTGVYILSGNPDHVVLGDNEFVTLTCLTDDTHVIVTWKKDDITLASINSRCASTTMPENTYNYTCDVANSRYYLIIPPDAITDGIQNSKWKCTPLLGPGSSKWTLTLLGTYGV